MGAVKAGIRNVFVLAAIGTCIAAQAVQAEQGVTENEIVIGLFAPLSGPMVGFGLDPLQAAKMWYEEVNKNGGINGRKIRTIVEDDRCNANDLVSVVKKLSTVDNVFIVNGGSCTAAVVAAQEYVTREKLPYVVLNASADGAVFPPTRYVFGAFGGSQRVGGATLIEFAAGQLRGKRLAYIAHDDDYGNANWAAAKAAAARLGVDIVDVERIAPKITDVTVPMLNIRAAKPDVILSSAYPGPTALLAQKYGEFGMTDIPLVVSPQSLAVPATFAKNIANDAVFKKFYYAVGFNDLADGPKQQKWLQMYKRYYPDRSPTAFMAYGLPSAMAVTAALKKAGRNLTRKSFIDAMEQTNLDTGVVAGPIVFNKDRRDGNRAQSYVKFDGKTSTLVGVEFWNGKDGM